MAMTFLKDKQNFQTVKTIRFFFKDIAKYELQIIFVKLQFCDNSCAQNTQKFPSIYIYIHNDEYIVPSRLQPQWLCGNACTWAHDARFIFVHDVPVMYMYIYLNFVCHVQMSKYMYKKLRHLFIQKLYFDFFQTFKDSKK